MGPLDVGDSFSLYHRPYDTTFSQVILIPILTNPTARACLFPSLLVYKSFVRSGLPLLSPHGPLPSSLFCHLSLGVRLCVDFLSSFSFSIMSNPPHQTPLKSPLSEHNFAQILLQLSMEPHYTLHQACRLSLTLL